jgi:hypothetical protein
MTFGSRERAMDWAKDNKVVAVPVHIDTRPTMRDVLKKIAAAEGEACGLSAQSIKYGTVGPWDEYFHISGPDPEDKWPADYRWIAVFVVIGGSEGLYLHIESIDGEGKRRLLMLGKTCASNRDAWDRCYASAGRISWLLNN